MRKVLLSLLLWTFSYSVGAKAQSICPTNAASDKMVCVIPQLYGPGGLTPSGGALLDNGHQGHFGQSFLTNLTPLNSAVGSQLTLLPLASPASGIIYSYNPTTGVLSASTESYGPILSERAATVGRHKFYAGFSYQHFDFETLDGVSLNNLPAVYTHINDSRDVPGRTCSITSDNTGACAFVRDVIATTNSVDLKLNQFTVFFTFGITSHFDVSIAIPIVSISMRATSRNTIIPNSTQNLHQFKGPGCPAPAGPTLPPACGQAAFTNAQNASGSGDVVLRGKVNVYKGERFGIAIGTDLRLPTGEELNFLGSGTIGVKPFAVASFQGRVAPHANVALEVNGNSLLAGDISVRSRGHLPNQFIYSVGADAGVTKWLSAAFDIVGQRVIKARRVSTTTFTDLGACKFVPSSPPDCSSPVTHMFPSLLASRDSFNITSASIGLKIRPVGKLLVTGNVLIKLDEGGLRSRFVPLIGISYTF